MDRLEETSLVEKLVAGDERAWGSFCQEYSGPLMDFVRRQLGFDREQSEEVVQRTFVRCVRSISTFNPGRGRLFPWLKSVARNEVRGCARGRSDVPMSTTCDDVVRRLPLIFRTISVVIGASVALKSMFAPASRLRTCCSRSTTWPKYGRFGAGCRACTRGDRTARDVHSDR